MKTKVLLLISDQASGASERPLRESTAGQLVEVAPSYFEEATAGSSLRDDPDSY
jgi:hypothetical protein